MKFFIPIPFLVLFVGQLNAQKLPLTLQAADEWKSIVNDIISPNGEFVSYEKDPQKGDGLLLLKKINGEVVVNFNRGKGAQFTYGSKYLIFKISPTEDTIRYAKRSKLDKELWPKDSLGIYSIAEDSTWKFPNAEDFKIPEKWSDWVAFLLSPVNQPMSDTTGIEEIKDRSDDNATNKPHEDQGSRLVLRQLSTRTDYEFSHVVEFLISKENGMFFFLTKGDSTRHSAAYAFDTQTKRLTLIDSSHVECKNIATDKTGDKAAFLATSDSIGTKEPHYKLLYWQKKLLKLSLLVISPHSDSYSNWKISEYFTPVFSDNDNRLFVGTAPEPPSFNYENDSTLLDEERVNLDVWSWTDKRIQPEQLAELEKDQKKSYLACFDLNKNEFVQLANEQVPDIYLDKKMNSPVAVGISENKYKQMLSWEVPYYRDAYLIDLATGKRDLIIQKTKGNPRLSPGGKFVYWYAYAESSWYTYQISNKTTVNLTKDIEVPFYNELNDIPTEAESYGSAGWTANDAAFLVYDRFDIWKIDPTGKAIPINLTDGYGRNKGLQFRYITLDDEVEYIPENQPFLMTAFQENNKMSGYFRDSLNAISNPIALILDNYRFFGLKKAKGSPNILFKKSSYQTFPDLWTSNVFINNPIKISDANPQQEDYAWGSAELTHWIDLDGEELQGIVYKPDNFSPLKKYPLIVYFYERISDDLHDHITPEPIRSRLNVPYFVSHGYVIFMPDIKYKIGYPGESALNCLVPGVLSLVDKGYVDKDRIGIWGHSWSGYEAAYIITRTDLFKAAVAGAPVVNMTSAYGGIRWGTGLSRMFQYESTQSRIGGTLWQKPLLYIENSPLFAANKINTPVLILHNDHDDAVPWYQGIEFFLALRRLHKPAWLLNYNGEVHNFNDRKNRLDYQQRMFQFFEHYLSGAPAPIWMEKGIPAQLKGKTLGLDPAGY